MAYIITTPCPHCNDASEDVTLSEATLMNGDTPMTFRRKKEAKLFVDKYIDINSNLTIRKI